METTKKIIRTMTIGQVVREFPAAANVFMRYGMSCFGCPATQFETVEAGALVHGLDPAVLEDELNAAIA